MNDDMGTFRITVTVVNPARTDERVDVPQVLVDTGSELSWFPAKLLEQVGVVRSRVISFRQASGAVVDRWTGVAIVEVMGIAAGDQVVFAEAGDLTLLGSRSLEGLNLMVDPARKRLVDSGALPAACAA